MNHSHSSSSRSSPLPRTEHYSLPPRTNSSAGSLRNHEDDYVDIIYERQRNWNSPRPIWHKSPPSPNLPKDRSVSPSFSRPASTPSPTTNGRVRTNSLHTSKHLNKHHHHSHTEASYKSHTTTEQKQPSCPLLPSSNEQSSPTSSPTSSLQAIDNTYHTNDLSLRHTSRSPSPLLSFSKERNGLPTTGVKTPVSSGKHGTNASFVDQQEENHSIFSHDMNAVAPVQNNNSRENHLSRRNSVSQLIETTELLPTPKNKDTVRDQDMESEGMFLFDKVEKSSLIIFLGLRETDFSSLGETDEPRVATSSPDISKDGSGTPLGNHDLPPGNGLVNIQGHTAQTDTIISPSTPTRKKASRSLRNEFKTPSPSTGLPDLPTPSSSDESDQSNRNGQSGLKWMATPKPPGGWLNTPKPSRELMEQGSPINNITQSDGDTPLATDDGVSYLKTRARAEATHGFRSFSKTPKPPGGWVSTPAPAPAQSMPFDSPLDIPERNQGLLTPVASLSKGSKLEVKTPAIPGAWLATPAVKKSILKVRFEPEVSTLTDKSLESTRYPDPSFDSNTPDANDLDVEDDGLQRTERLSSKSPPSPRRQKLLKSPKIRVLDAFGREHEPDVFKKESVNSSPRPLRVVDAMGHEIDEENHVEGIEAAVVPSSSVSSPSVSSRGELLSRIRNGLDDLVVGIDEFDK